MASEGPGFGLGSQGDLEHELGDSMDSEDPGFSLGNQGDLEDELLRVLDIDADDFSLSNDEQEQNCTDELSSPVVSVLDNSGVPEASSVVSVLDNGGAPLKRVDAEEIFKWLKEDPQRFREGDIKTVYEKASNPNGFQANVNKMMDYLSKVYKLDGVTGDEEFKLGVPELRDDQLWSRLLLPKKEDTGKEKKKKEKSLKTRLDRILNSKTSTSSGNLPGFYDIAKILAASDQADDGGGKKPKHSNTTPADDAAEGTGQPTVDVGVHLKVEQELQQEKKEKEELKQENARLQQREREREKVKSRRKNWFKKALKTIEKHVGERFFKGGKVKQWDIEDLDASKVREAVKGIESAIQHVGESEREREIFEKLDVILGQKMNLEDISQHIDDLTGLTKDDLNKFKEYAQTFSKTLRKQNKKMIEQDKKE
ncbi:hypothetical protein TrCOL_g10332 [Triparma columacea]|uniref:Uncharacterized protein n=1 Tax=Triparma columacea TaxID=722753 RepID=A0A9W7G744_9STRA|nr:hypothetical protein TrCOL_g10332 [Triparma columacea]